MSHISEIGARFDTALKKIKVKNKEISEVFNTSSQNISNLKKSDRLNDLMSRIAIKYKININWIMTGEGDMFLDKNSQINNIVNSSAHDNSSIIDNSKHKSISDINNAASTDIPDDIYNDISNLFQMAQNDDKLKELIVNFDDFIYTQKKILR